jgi:hypothetical protein
MSVNVGGQGGRGGAGSTVDVTNNGYIFTTGQGASGIAAQSVGGGGGDAGLVLDISGGVPGSTSTTHSFLLDIGGSGGPGGTAGNVTVTNQGTGAAGTGYIYTTGDNAYGVLAQSIGGGGGSGSSIIQVTALKTGQSSGTAGLAIGGSGGNGLTGGNVTVTNAGTIETWGKGAHGIVAQSVGGGGGNGGMSIAANIVIGAPKNAPLISIGGAGGNGGDGGTVTVNNSGEIITNGANANGIVAQSIGGGGGNANMGFAVTGEVNTLVMSNALAAIIGAVNGGNGGVGGKVIVNQTGDITVLGQGSQAIVAQSINGGGGTLTLDFSGITGLPGVPFIGGGGQTVTPMPSVTAVVGGNGNSDMNGGLVTINATGTFNAAGDNSAGGFLQSIGGGGGTALIHASLVAQSNDPTLASATPVAIPFSLSLGGTNGTSNAGGGATGGYTGALLTTGADSPAQLVQSIGGGGGRGVLDLTVPQGALIGPLTVSLGGTNGQTEPGEWVDFNQSGALATEGVTSPGALLQSVGGGGGTVFVRLQGAGAGSATLWESLGSNGGSGLNGGEVDAIISGGITTWGDHSTGLFAQSVGAGGGDIRMTGVSAWNVTLGGSNGAAGDGGPISVWNTGAVTTYGAGSHGVFLESVGGGGGAVFGDPANVSFNTSSTGNGGAINFTQVGDITTWGAGSYGIIALSIGGGGGWVDGLFTGTAGGTGAGGAITLGQTGNITAPTDGAYAIYAQSTGSLGGGNIAITINSGTILGGSGSGASVGFAGGANNSLVNWGMIMPSNGLAGYAVRGGVGNEATDNFNYVLGSIDMGAGHNTFFNHPGAFFDAGPNILLGIGGLHVNAGVLQLGKSAPMLSQDLTAAQVTTETGDFVQTSTGKMIVDISFGPYPSDQLNVAGHATLGGEVDVTLLKLTDDKPVHLIPTTSGGALNSPTAPGTLALSYGFAIDGNDIDLTLTPHFDAPLTRPNAIALGKFLNHTLDVGGASDLNNLLLFLGELQDLSVYRRSIDLLSPEVYLAPYQATMYAGEDATSNVLSCHTNDGAISAIAESSCGWVKVYLKDLNRNATANDYGYNDHESGLATGLQQHIGGPWIAGVSLGWDHHDITVRNVPAGFTGDLLTGSAAIKRQQGHSLLALAIAGGGGNWEGNRSIILPGPGLTPDQAHSNFSTHFVHVDGRAAYLFAAGQAYAKPMLDLNIDYDNLGAFSEVGAGPIGSRSPGTDRTMVVLKPSIEFGRDFGHGGPNLFVRPWINVGLAWRPDGQFDLPVAFVGSVPQAGTYTQTSRLDRVSGTVSAGLDLIKGGVYNVSVDYEGEFGADYKRQGGRLKISLPF